jgi:hypothetical protein
MITQLKCFCVSIEMLVLYNEGSVLCQKLVVEVGEDSRQNGKSGQVVLQRCGARDYRLDAMMRYSVARRRKPP